MQSVKVNKILFWDNEDNRFYDLEFDAIFSADNITLTVKQINNSSEITLPNNVILPISIEHNNGDTNRDLFKIVNLTFAMTPNQAMTVEAFYKSLNEELETKINQECDNIVKISDSLGDEVFEMALNLLKLSEQKYLLDHDTVIVFQKMMSPNKVDNIKVYDENILDNQNYMDYITPFYDAINTFADLLKEEYGIEEDLKQNIAWELVRRASIKFYSDMWENLFSKYINNPLKTSINKDEKPDGTLDRYIEEIILCNEINHKSDEVLGIFTYHMMEKGYTSGWDYFPAYFDICKQAFEVIGDNLRKNSFKNKLKGNVEIKESHYSIDDIDIMNGSEFENFIGSMFSKMGYSAEVTKHSGDQGIDVIAEKNGKKVGIQAKCYSNSVGNSAIQEAVAGKNYYKCDRVIVVTNNTFTSSAIDLAKVNDVILWDRSILKEKISELF